MRKTTIVAVSALAILTNYEASAMTLGSLRPNIMRAAAEGRLEHAIQPAGLSWLIAVTATTIEQLREIAQHAAPARTKLPETIDI